MSTTGRVRIEHAGSDLSDDISRLHCQLFAAGWDAASIRSLLTRPGIDCLVARMGQREIMAFVLYQACIDEAEILAIGVRQDVQRKGIARALLLAATRNMDRSGVKRIVLEVAADNAAAIALYANLRFVEIGRRSAYYVQCRDEAVDALVLARDIRPTGIT